MAILAEWVEPWQAVFATNNHGGVVTPPNTTNITPNNCKIRAKNAVFLRQNADPENIFCCF